MKWENVLESVSPESPIDVMAERLLIYDLSVWP
jgi:hypothetical protein